MTSAAIHASVCPESLVTGLVGGDGMRFRVLGPLRVRSGDGWVAVTAAQQRVVLAMLLANAGQVVSSEKLVDAVWPDCSGWR